MIFAGFIQGFLLKFLARFLTEFLQCFVLDISFREVSSGISVSGFPMICFRVTTRSYTRVSPGIYPIIPAVTCSGDSLEIPSGFYLKFCPEFLLHTQKIFAGTVFLAQATTHQTHKLIFQ